MLQGSKAIVINMNVPPDLFKKMQPIDSSNAKQLEPAPFTRDDHLVKWEWDSLLKQGAQRLTVEELQAVALDQFPSSTQRKKLFEGFSRWIRSLLDIVPSCTVFVNGGFLTRKPYPKDVDIVAFIDGSTIEALSQPEIDQLEELFNRDVTLATFLVDSYVEPAGIPERDKYWREQFGLRYDRKTPKGFAIIELTR
jgi:hypothetical protein